MIIQITAQYIDESQYAKGNSEKDQGGDISWLEQEIHGVKIGIYPLQVQDNSSSAWSISPSDMAASS